MVVCCKNLYYTQKLQKRTHNKSIKPRSHTLGEKVWLNSKYIKTKQNQKLEAKFFRPFRVLYLIGKQMYKLELSKKWKIHDVFHMLLLEQGTTRKKRVDKEVRQIEFDTSNNSGEYKAKAIWDSAVYVRESKSGHLSGLYYLVL